VFIGDRPRDVDDGITNPFKKSTDETSVTFIDETVFVSENSKFLFVQIQTWNEFFGGNLSEPFQIPLEPQSFSSCNFTITRGVRGKEESGFPMPDYALGLIAVGAVLLVAIAVLLVCCCYVSHRRRRMMAVFKARAQNVTPSSFKHTVHY
jgi:hypothetical protein